MCWWTDSAEVRDCLIDLGADPNLFPRGGGGCGPGCALTHMWWYYATRQPDQLRDLLRHVASGRLVVPKCCPCVPRDRQDGDDIREARALRAAYEAAVYCAIQSHLARDVASLARDYLFRVQ